MLPVQTVTYAPERTEERMTMNLTRVPVAALSALFLAGSVAQAAGGLVLVKDGQPTAAIVIAAKPSENAQVAAEEFQRCIEKMSGARLPIVSDKQAAGPGALVLIGRSRLTDGMRGLKIPSGVTKNLREEGFAIYCRGNRLVLAGNDAEPYYGTRYAVSDVLNRLGMRWFLPGDYGEVAPKAATIEVPEMSVVERPSFPMRNFWTHSEGTMDAERDLWKVRNKMNPRIQQWFGVPGDGSVNNYLPKDQFDAHPEMFAMSRDGGREKSTPCMTNPDMINSMIERVKADARAGRRVSAFAPEDGVPRCFCPNCRKVNWALDGYGSNDRDPEAEASTSQEWFYFVNRILEGVNKEFPDHLIATNGYSNREIAPQLPDFNKSKNLVVMFANICACTIHAYDDPRCWQMERQAEMLKQWTRICDKVWIYSYNYTMLVGKGTITPMVHRIRRNIPLLKEYGLIGFLDQDEADMSLTGIPTHIVRAALEWNTKADVEAVLDDFFAKWFGAAAKPVRAYYDALEEAFNNAPQHGHEDVILPAIYTPELMAALDQAITGAERLTNSDTEKLHVRAERLSYDHLRAYVALEKAKQECNYAEAARQVERMLVLKDQLHAITPFYGWSPYPVYGAAWERDRMRRLDGKVSGSEGTLIAMLPVEAKFRTDPFDDGRYNRWDDPLLDDSNWRTLATTTGWENQGLMNANGHPYRGVAYYRLKVDLPADAAGKSVWIFIPAADNEVWVWVNGRYAGHRPYMRPWSRPQEAEMDISRLIEPGKTNQVAVRVLCNFDVFGANGIYERMFIYAKKSTR
jgi:hypothetical protein